MRYVVIVLAISLIAGCATNAKFVENLKSWEGNHADGLIVAWGPPQSESTLSNGEKVLQYYYGRNVNVSFPVTTPTTTQHYGTVNGQSFHGYSTSTQTQMYNSNVHYWCKIVFRTNSAGYIYSWRWEGNNCVAK